jgi:mRNA-degrading endonuclease YafQ of YafQ-DinJ toxin-antitoxin module
MVLGISCYHYLPPPYDVQQPCSHPCGSELFATSHHKPFRFENWWLQDNEYHDIAKKKSWRRSSNQDFSQKTKFLAADLRKWRKKKPRNNDLLAQIEQQILDQQNLPPSRQNHTLQQNLHDKHQELLAKEETYHIQRAKK